MRNPGRQEQDRTKRSLVKALCKLPLSSAFPVTFPAVLGSSFNPFDGSI